MPEFIIQSSINFSQKLSRKVVVIHSVQFTRRRGRRRGWRPWAAGGAGRSPPAALAPPPAQRRDKPRIPF